MKNRYLEGKGEADYDYEHDIILFKASERDYAKSIEMDNIVLDIDRENFIMGMQIFEASKFLNTSKNMLLKIPHWSFNAKIHDGKIEVRLDFKVMHRNRIIEKNPIIMQQSPEKLPNSELVCRV